MNKVISIVGPTGVGKTKLSIELAKKLNGEIINADSTQIYKELNIATAKVTTKEMEGIKHYLIDFKDINDDYNVYNYQSDCRKCIETIKNNKKVPIIVGGTGLYIKAALYNYEFNNEEDFESFENLSNDELYEKLIQVDPNTKIHKNNRKRVIRSLNFYLNNKRPQSENSGSNKLLYDTIFIGLTLDRENLYNIINNRVDKMLSNGLIEEAKLLYDRKIYSKAVMTPIGYKELFEYFDKKITLEEAIILIKQRSRKYAKRQYTWFKNQMSVKWFEVDRKNFNNTVNLVYDYIKKQ